MADDFPPNVKVLKDLQYGPHGDANKLDLYLPKDMNAKTPVIVWIHGGSWSMGKKEPWPAIALVDKGYAVASIDYRLSGNTTFPAQVRDAKAAVRWIRENADKYNIDPNRMGAWGSSAGGHLAALVGTSGDDKELEGTEPNPLRTSSKVQAVCVFCGPTDLKAFSEYRPSFKGISPDAPKEIVTKLFGGDLKNREVFLTQANPINYVSPKSPPMLIMHGDADPLVPVSQSQMLADALKKSGVKSELIILPGIGHRIFQRSKDLWEVERFFDESLLNIDDSKRAKAQDDTKVVATFDHAAVGGKPRSMDLYADGRIFTPANMNTWKLEGDQLTLKWYTEKSPTGMWTDVCTLDKDGKTYHGKNQEGTVVSGKLTNGMNLRDFVKSHPDVDIIPASYRSEDVSLLPRDAALSRMTGAHWEQVEGGYKVAISGFSPAERKDAVMQLTEILNKNLGGIKGATFTQSSMMVDDALAKKITDKFAELQAQDKKVAGNSAADFTRKFSSNKGPLTQGNYERTRADLDKLADLARGMPNSEKPEIRMDKTEAVLVFKDQLQADRFSTLLLEAQSKAGIDKSMVAVDAPKDKKSVSVRYVKLNSLSSKEAAAFFDKAAEAVKVEQKKAVNPSKKVSLVEPPVDFNRDLLASVDRIEQMFGSSPAQAKPDVVEVAQLPSPRILAAMPAIDTNGPSKV